MNVISADIAVPEHARVLRFYSRVLTTGEAPLWREDLMSADGVPIVGLGERVPEYEQLPLQWMPHIQVADIAGSVERALALGGKELMHGKGEDGASQWAVLLDPGGAAFGLIPVVPAEALPSMEGVGSDTSERSAGRIAWVDLTVSDASTMREFYREVVGWSVDEVPMKDGGESYADYNMLGADGSPEAGVCHARGVNREFPPVWLIYLQVGDLEESLLRVRAEGGQVLAEARGADGAWSHAVIQDPVGACLGLVP